MSHIWLEFRQSGRNFSESSLVLARNSNSLSKWTIFLKIWQLLQIFFQKQASYNSHWVFLLPQFENWPQKNSARGVELFSSFKQRIGCQMNQKLKRKFRTILERNVFSLCRQIIGLIVTFSLPSAPFPENLDLDYVGFVYKLVHCINTSIKDPARLV
jgi:hypothetical protein